MRIEIELGNSWEVGGSRYSEERSRVSERPLSQKGLSISKYVENEQNHAPSLDGNQQSCIEYIASLTTELSQMAADSGFSLISSLLASAAGLAEHEVKKNSD